MKYQYFGKVHWNKEDVEAMFCVDGDKTDEGMLHIWDPSGKFPEKAGGIKIALRHMGEDIFGNVIGVFKPSKGGEVSYPVLSAEELEFFSKMEIGLKVNGDCLVGEWKCAEISGNISLCQPYGKMRVVPEVLGNWDDFKSWASIARSKYNIAWFRGHGCNSFKLSTTLARANRLRLERYCDETLREFQAHVEALTGDRVDLSNTDDYAITLGLAQHHGLPTPLLDWTRSAYVAAFFAFADVIESGRDNGENNCVRIYGVTRDFLDIFISRIVTVPFYLPYVSPLTVSPRNNPRLYAQQGQFFVTNVGDVEGYICSLEEKSGKKFIYAVDVPKKFAANALEDLSFMGLNAATMFPGLDGICKMMKHSMMKVGYERFDIVKPKGISGEERSQEGNV